MSSAGVNVHSISVVIPVYRGATSIGRVVDELAPHRLAATSPDGHLVRVDEVLLVHDCGPDGSEEVIRELAERYDWVTPVWLSRNFGQHAATLAGASKAAGDWVVTMDEDGQHDPADMMSMLDAAMLHGTSVVYAKPVNVAPHGPVRNAASKLAKESLRWTTGDVRTRDYHSFRLVLGSVAREVATYAGPGIYLDVALGWIVGDVATVPVHVREEDSRRSGYGMRTLMSHYWRMVITGGTRMLRLVSVCGVGFAALGIALSMAVVILRISGEVDVPGWTSLAVVFLLGTGAMLFSLGVIAEYLGVTVSNALGRPLFMTVRDPGDGPHGWPPAGRDVTDD